MMKEIAVGVCCLMMSGFMAAQAQEPTQPNGEATNAASKFYILPVGSGLRYRLFGAAYPIDFSDKYATAIATIGSTSDSQYSPPYAGITLGLGTGFGKSMWSLGGVPPKQNPLIDHLKRFEFTRLTKDGLDFGVALDKGTKVVPRMTIDPIHRNLLIYAPTTEAEVESADTSTPPPMPVIALRGATGQIYAKGGMDAGGSRIENVADGVKDSDAVTVRQLKAALHSSPNDHWIRAGIAQALSASGLPQAYLPGDKMLAVSASSYRGETGYAIGFSHVSDDNHYVYKVNGSGDSRGHFGVTVGAGFRWQ